MNNDDYRIMFHFNSGRWYRRGQRITVIKHGADVIFNDHSRNVFGVIRGAGNTAHLVTPRTIMAVYDSGLYDHVKGEEYGVVHATDHYGEEDNDHLFKEV
jgi:hypothetical protein